MCLALRRAQWRAATMCNRQKWTARMAASSGAWSSRSYLCPVFFHIVDTMCVQLRPGVDLSKITFPAFIMEPRSFLDKFSDSFYHSNFLNEAVLMKACLLSMYHTNLALKVPRRPKSDFWRLSKTTFLDSTRSPRGSRSHTTRCLVKYSAACSCAPPRTASRRPAATWWLSRCDGNRTHCGVCVFNFASRCPTTRPSQPCTSATARPAG